MIKFLALLLDVINRLLASGNERRWKQQGRQEIEQEAVDEVRRQVELAERVAATVDPEYDQRLRSRFDAASRDQ